MSSRSKGDQGEYEFTKAAYDELKDAELTHLVRFTLALHPSAQRGVWSLVIMVQAKGEHEVISYSNRYEATWPNAVSISYGAFLYQCCHRVVRMVEAWSAQREQDEAPRN